MGRFCNGLDYGIILNLSVIDQLNLFFVPIANTLQNLPIIPQTKNPRSVGLDTEPSEQ
jgi:hypothetical protein